MPIVDDEENPHLSPPAATAPQPATSTTLVAAARREADFADDAIVAQVPLLKRYALALTRSADLAEDLVQDCVTRALSRRHLFRSDAGIRPWLFTIMHNLHVNSRRQAYARSALAMRRGGVTTDAVAPNQEHAAELSKVVRALKSLPKQQQHVMLLVVVQELSYREAADTLGIPVGTVMSRLARGRERMRALLEVEDSMRGQES